MLVWITTTTITAVQQKGVSEPRIQCYPSVIKSIQVRLPHERHGHHYSRKAPDWTRQNLEDVDFERFSNSENHDYESKVCRACLVNLLDLFSLPVAL